MNKKYNNKQNQINSVRIKKSHWTEKSDQKVVPWSLYFCVLDATQNAAAGSGL